MKYKPGDKVRIKSLEWYNTFKGELGIVDCGQWYFDKKMSRFCGKIVTICESDDMFNWYRISEENDQHIRYNNNMIEGLADEPHKKMVSLDKVCNILYDMLHDQWINDGAMVGTWAYENMVDFVEDFCKKLEE